MLDRRQFANLPWGLVTLILAIAAIGLVTVYSATFTAKGPSSLFYKQLMWMAIGLVVMICAMIPDYHTVGRYAYVLYAASIVFLILVMFVGRTGMGAQRWLPLGPFAFQPSELAKISLTLALARYFAEDPKRGGYDLRDLAVPGIMVLVPFMLVVKQPDLGTAMMLLLTSTLIVVIAGIRMRAVLIVLLIGATMAAAMFLVTPVRNKIWGSLKPYQQNRIKAFLDPSIDPRGTGYHANQSKIAVGSGQITGKGYRRGTQSQMAFLPERHTDFIFAVLSEERGFIGSSLLVVLYLTLLLTGVDTAKNAKDRLGTLMAGGIVSMLSLYVFINIGMSVGIAPVVGVPLPLMSYGGTSIIATFLAIGLLLNIQTRRFMLFY
ncbi:MAG: rod shape-determining protein RodA [Nitrospirae bacterium GWD2_57_9]|nr:MAG: rod shape-determining protein RodA [Nitrospirae bacterium GWD2_57_9]